VSAEDNRCELEAAGWKPVVHVGDVAWRHPKSRFLYPQSMALRLLRKGAYAEDASEKKKKKKK